MNQLFILRTCPYCKRTLRQLDELKEEFSELASVIDGLKIVAEEEKPDYANSYDYHLVPTLFKGNEKLFEGDVKKEVVEAAIRKLL